LRCVGYERKKVWRSAEPLGNERARYIVQFWQRGAKKKIRITFFEHLKLALSLSDDFWHRAK
jgi:hypothetical protein